MLVQVLDVDSEGLFPLALVPVPAIPQGLGEARIAGFGDLVERQCASFLI